MKILSIGTDRKLFERGSDVASRMATYGSRVDALHIVVFTLRSAGLSERAITPHVFVYPTNSSSRLMFVWDAIRIGKRIARISKFKPREAVVTCQDAFECGFVGWRISLTTGLPLHLQIHTDFLNPNFTTTSLQKFRVRLARFLLPKADGIRVVSTRIADSLVREGIILKHPPQILPIRINAEAIESTALADPFQRQNTLKELFPQFSHCVFMASRLTPEKRIEDGISALAKLGRQFPKVALIIAGGGIRRQALEAHAALEGVSDRVIFLGYRGDIAILMRSADVFLSTSGYEGYGMSIIEAAMAHTPIVSTDAGAAGRMFSDDESCCICPVGDIACIASKIKLILSDLAFGRRLATAAYAIVANHLQTQEEYAESYISGLSKLLGEFPR